MRIAVIGSGYVGLVSGICLAKIGHEITCVDNDEAKINALKQEQIPIFEPGLKEMLLEAKQKNLINFTTNLREALKDVKAVFIAVGTPQGEDGSADLSYVLKACEQIAALAGHEILVITKSTVPVGTGKKVKEVLQNSQQNFLVASNPEFLREGSAIADFMNPDRIVVGCDDEKAKKLLAEIYQYFPSSKIVYTDIVTAELIKYAANSFLATKISFINEMADLCERTNANIKQLSYAIGLDSRIGDKFLSPGPGFGGSCFPKDIMAIINIAKENEVELSLINSVIASNGKRKENMVKKVKEILGQDLSNKKIAVLGLAFKANTDDIRYSPAISIVKGLNQAGAHLKLSDIEAIENSKKELKDLQNIEFFNDEYSAIKDADLIIIATEWQQYKELDFAKIKQLTKSRKILDLRNLHDAKEMQNFGFEYSFIGGKT